MGVGRREFEGSYRDLDRRMKELEQWRRDHGQEHDDDEDERRDGRRWTFTQIVAVIVATVTVSGFWLNALGK